MYQRGRLIFWLFLSIAAAAGGTIWWDHARTEADARLEDGLSAVQGTLRSVEPAPRTKRLTLALDEGDVFPLLKTVEETITQDTERGPVHSRTTLRLVLSIRVQEVRADRKRLRVDFQRVQFEREFPDETVRYDSISPPRELPPDVQAYHGLVRNGFEFWIGEDNQIRELVDFSGFLNRCVLHVPADRREAVLTRLLKCTGDEGVANFVDDSIGMLPYRGKSAAEGATWKRDRQVTHPVSLSLSQRCTLQRIGEKTAEIKIEGEILPAATDASSDRPQDAMTLTVTGGKTHGVCRIRCATGLPEHSEIHRNYEMIVRTRDGRQFRQAKSSRTVIEAWSPQTEPKPFAGATASR